MELGELELRLADDLNDDWYGLYEVGWRLNTLGYDPEPAARITVARKLVEAGVMDVYLSDWNSIRAAAPLAVAEAVEAISEPLNWEPPTGDARQFYIVGFQQRR